MLKCFSKILGIAGYAVQYGCMTHCTFEYIGDFVICNGPSMEPTLYSNNILVTERITPRLNKVQRGDIIIAKCPTNPTQHICKRVIGLPGDKIISAEPTIQSISKIDLNSFEFSKESEENLDSINVIIKNNLKDKNNNETQEVETASSVDDVKPIVLPLQTFKKNLSPIEIIVPRGHVWIEGDNSENSADSRYYGPIPQGLIKSRAVCRLWPLNEIKVF